MREEPEKGLWLTANWHQVRDDWRAEEGARKVKEDWGDVDEEAW